MKRLYLHLYLSISLYLSILSISFYNPDSQTTFPFPSSFPPPPSLYTKESRCPLNGESLTGKTIFQNFCYHFLEIPKKEGEGWGKVEVKLPGGEVGRLLVFDGKAPVYEVFFFSFFFSFNSFLFTHLSLPFSFFFPTLSSLKSGNY